MLPVYLGLDVSTSCTGWCVFTSKGMFVDMGKIELAKKLGVYQKADAVRSELNNLFIKHSITRVYIEENLQAFRPGLSSAKTLSVLARFNGIVSLLCYDIFNLEPEHLNVNAARKALGIKLIRKKHGGAPTKEQVFTWVHDDLLEQQVNFDWPRKILKSGPRKGIEILHVGSYDMADAYVIARAGILKHGEHNQNLS
jgi:Holliday junction resolvasome RuvABC endonuclease subunit